MKTLEVASCNDCPFFSCRSASIIPIRDYCNLEGEDLPYDVDIPEWCPLRNDTISVKFISG